MEAEDKQIIDESNYTQQTIALQMVVNDDVELINKQNLLTIIRTSAFEPIPRIETQLVDFGQLLTSSPLTDQDIFKIKVGTTKDTDDIIDAKFRIQGIGVEPSNGYTQSNHISFVGLIEAGEMFYTINNKAYKNMNSKDVFSEVARRNNLKFICDIETSDKMTWYQINQNDYEFLNHVSARAKSSGGRLVWFVNLKNELVLTNFDKVLKTNEIKFKTKFTKDLNIVKGDEDIVEEESDKILISSYSIKNLSGFLNNSGGYKTQYSFFDNENENYVDIDVTTDLAENNLRASDYKNNVTRFEYFGNKTPNTYISFEESVSKNISSFLNLFKFCIELKFVLNVQPEEIKDKLDINLFDKIFLDFVNISHQPDLIYSGQYIIGAVTYTIKRTSKIEVKLLLFRGGNNYNANTNTDFILRL